MPAQPGFSFQTMCQPPKHRLLSSPCQCSTASSLPLQKRLASLPQGVITPEQAGNMTTVGADSSQPIPVRMGSTPGSIVTHESSSPSSSLEDGMSVLSVSSSSSSGSKRKVSFLPVVKVGYTHASEEYDRESTPTSGPLTRDDIEEVLEMRRRFYYQSRFLEHQRDQLLSLLPQPSPLERQDTPQSPSSECSDATLTEEVLVKNTPTPYDAQVFKYVEKSLLDIQRDAVAALS